MSVPPMSLYNIPGQKPPPGIIPNFDHPETRASKLIAANAICLVFAMFFVVARVYTRAVVTKSLGVDDYVCMVAMAVTTIFCSMTIVLTHFGLGTHQWDVRLSVIVGGWLKWNVTSEIIYICALMLVKLSILLLYRRVFNQAKKTFAWVIDGSLIFTFGFSMACIFAIIFACSPVNKLWDYRVIGGHCLNAKALAISHAALNIFTDLLILVIPIPIVWRLQLNVRTKIQVLSILGLGAFVCGVSFVRLVILINGGAENFQPDATWKRFDNNLWSVIECNFGIVCACAPTLQPILARALPKLSSAFSNFSSQRTRSLGSKHFGSAGATGTHSSDYVKAPSMEEGTSDLKYPLETWNGGRPRGQESHVTAVSAQDVEAEKLPAADRAHHIHKTVEMDVTRSVAEAPTR